jgi:lipopolysaccharide assembly outer membrane protein LptD (OstA)
LGFFTLKVLRVFLIAVFIFHFAGQSTAQELSKNIPDSLKSSVSDTNKLLPKVDSTVISPSADTSATDSVMSRPKKKGALDAEVKYQAEDSIVFNLREKGAKLYGSATVDYEKINLKAATIEQNWVTNEVIALPVTDSLGNLQGKPKFKDGDQEFESRKMIYNFKSKKARISQMVTNEGESYLIGQEVKLNPDQSVYIKNTKYTTCSHTDHPHFYLNLYKAKIIPNKSVVSGPANMVVEGIPVPLGLPFAIIPTQRGQRSGILPPEYGRSPELGFFLRNFGYYFAIWI